MNVADVNGDGTIDYLEFIIATMHMNRMDREDHLYTAFQYFDKDSNGYITKEELEKALINMRNAMKKSWNLANVKKPISMAIQYQETFSDNHFCQC
jgi:calcium-dependent protein kinase